MATRTQPRADPAKADARNKQPSGGTLASRVGHRPPSRGLAPAGRTTRAASATTTPTEPHASSAAPPASAPSGTASALAAAGPSNLALFLTNLRLLDFDRHEDWPHITTQTFAARDAAQGQKKRVHCVEWALVRLFELWDPAEAESKLAPYFPPADQTHSIALRAALLKLLENAKKAGVLGRDAVIRKTMLDECRGDRLEEVLAVFSSAVLKKVVADGSLPDGTPVTDTAALRAALEHRGYQGDRGDLLALVLAHRASLTGLLRSKESSRERYTELAQLLDAKETTITSRRDAVARARSLGVDSVNDDTRLDAWRLVRNNWSGNERWMEALLHGDSAAGSRDAVLNASFDKLWRRADAGRLAEVREADRAEGGLLANLDRRVRTQQGRLEKWRAFRDRMLQGEFNGDSQKMNQDDQPHRGIDLGFTRHQPLSLLRSSPRKARATEAKEAAPGLGDYASLVADMRQELREIDSGRGIQLPPVTPSASSTGPADTATHSDDENISELSELEEDHAPSKSPEPIEPVALKPPAKSSTFDSATVRRGSRPVIRPKVGRSMTSTDATEPTALPRFRQLAHYDDEPDSPPPAHNPTSSLAQVRAASPPIWPVSKRPSIPQPHQASISRSPEPVEPTPVRQSSRSFIPHPDDTDEPQDSPATAAANAILASMNRTTPSPTKKPRHTLSLAERTRLTLNRATGLGASSVAAGGFHSDDDEDEQLTTASISRRQSPTRRQPQPTTLAPPNQSATATSETPDEESDTLLSRTRKSMAGFEAARKRAQVERRKSLRRAAKAATAPPPPSLPSIRRNGLPAPLDEEDDEVEDEDGGVTILAEELMTEEDAEAVFRSRPKLKTSPAATPRRSYMEDD